MEWWFYILVVLGPVLLAGLLGALGWILKILLDIRVCLARKDVEDEQRDVRLDKHSNRFKRIGVRSAGALPVVKGNWP